MMDQHPKHAIVYGASGIIGWAVVDQILAGYPEQHSFAKVTAITNRHVNLSESQWTEESPDRPDLQLVSGIDVRQFNGDTLAQHLESVVADVKSVTHVYYLVFTSMNDITKEVETNTTMFQSVIDAHNKLSTNLQFVVFPGGTRGYGIYEPGGMFTPPLSEEMVERIPTSYADTVVYTHYRKMLTKASIGKKWTWSEVCPDAIIGFTPNGSQFSLALHWAQYLSLYAHNHGVGLRHSGAEASKVEVPFPGNAAGANSLFSSVSNKTIARFMIYASLHPEKCGNGQLFNVADHDTPCKYTEVWPKLAAWFGLVGTVPEENSASADKALGVGQLPEDSSSLQPSQYIAKHAYIFAEQGLSQAAGRGVGAGSQQLDSVGYWLTFNRQLSLKRLYETGFDYKQDPVQGWLEAFGRFRKAGLIL